MFNYHRQWTINHAGFKFFKRRTNKQERAKLKEQLREPQ